MLIKSRPERWENSTAKTIPLGPTMSATWLTEVPEAAPRYRTLLPGRMKISSRPPRMPAASLLRKGFQTLYSVLVVVVVPSAAGVGLFSMAMRFSP